MSLFLEPDFSPTPLSPRWLVLKCRPNMHLHKKTHIISILESGLLFREDSATVEQALESEWASGTSSTWFTSGERWLSAGAVMMAVVAAPPGFAMSRRGACARLVIYTSCVLLVWTAHRHVTRRGLQFLLEAMSSYTVLARKMLVCLKEYKIVRKDLEAMSTALLAASSLLQRQTNSLVTLLARSSLAVLANVPWLRDDLPCTELKQTTEADLTKIHHALLVMQSTFLKLVALAHLDQPQCSKKIYQHHNERLYWLHTQVIQYLFNEISEYHKVLERTYMCLKNVGYNDTSIAKKGISLTRSWLYSDVHNGIARASIELKLAAQKCSKLDILMEESVLEKQPFDVDKLDNEMDELIDEVTECLSTLQHSQIRLKKIESKLKPSKENHDMDVGNVSDEDDNVIQIEDKDPEAKDEVFYFVKTEDDTKQENAVDVVTAPGKKEKDATKIVLGELKRKLVKREDIMREREKVALENTMPELKGQIPDFPRQTTVDEAPDALKGAINKTKKIEKKNKQLRNKHQCKSKVNNKYASDSITSDGNTKDPRKEHLTFSTKENKYIVTRWVKNDNPADDIGSSLSEGLSDVESAATNDVVHQAININAVTIVSDEDTTNDSIFNGVSNPCHSGPSSTSDPVNGSSSGTNTDPNNVTPHSSTGTLDPIKTTSELSGVLPSVSQENTSHVAPSVTQSNTSHVAPSLPQESSDVRKDVDMIPTSSESDLEYYKERKEQMSLLKDIRKHRVARKKNHPKSSGLALELEKSVSNADVELMDESLKPVEYSFGTGMALASVFQGRQRAMLLSVGQEEVFVGDGEVSNDSGNDDNA